MKLNSLLTENIWPLDHMTTLLISTAQMITNCWVYAKEIQATSPIWIGLKIVPLSKRTQVLMNIYYVSVNNYLTILIFFEDEAPTGKHITDRKLTEKLHRWSDWQSWTGVLGDLVDGIWPKGSDKTDINSLDTTKTGTILATGDDFGFVKLFEYPCKQRGAEFKKFAGHSAHVTNVRFNFDDTFLISTGGGDRTIFQWKLK